jgi:arylsulfatase A-like enzyme
VAAACLILTLPATGHCAEGRPPNIVFILADDLGWTDMGFAGSRFYETPHLDGLAAGGMRLTSFYGSLNGAPARAAFFSGQYAPRTGVYATGSLERGEASERKLIPPPNRAGLPASTATLATVLKQGGYATGIFGKWQLGLEPGNHPKNRGFDEVFLAEGKYFDFSTEPALEGSRETYLTDLLTERALDFLERHQEGPFFLHLAHFAVHAPYEGKRSLISRFEKKPPAGGHRDAVYAAMIASLDESVGRLLAKLDELNIATRTVVIFSSDNGGVGGYPLTDGGNRRVGITDNAPLRGGKGMLYEGGIRVPFAVRWPGGTQPGSRSPQPCLHVDIFPTLCEIAGIRPPANHVLDGISLVPLLRDPGAHLGRDAIFWHFPGYIEAHGRPGWRMTPGAAVRAGNFKLIESFEDGRAELYNLIEDIGENNNLVHSLPEKAAELREKLAAWRNEVNAPMPQSRSAAVANPNSPRLTP